MNTTNSTIPHFTVPPRNFFGFVPNKGLEIAVLIILVVLTIAMLIQNIRKRTWFMMPIVYGGLIEILGFSARIYTTWHTDSQNGFIIYLVPVIVAPTVLAAADYALAGPVMAKGRVRVACCTPSVSKYSFLIFDILAFLIQGFGATLVGTGKSLADVQRGSNIILGGLAISLSVFVIFLFYSIILHRRILAKIRKNGGDDEFPNWTRIFWVVYFNMMMLTIRAFYRVAEFEQKGSGQLSTNEGYFYGLDIFLMVLLMASWVVFHPSRFNVKAQGKKGSVDSEKGEYDVNHS